MSFHSPLGFPSSMSPTMTATANDTRPTTTAEPERFVHPARWPPKIASLRARGASRLAPVSESVTPRRLRPAPWGIFPSKSEEGDDEEEEKENSPEANSCSVLRVASSPSSSSAAAASAASASSSSSSSYSSCFPRTVVRRSRIAGLGLYALARISRGSAVAEYSGELVRAPLADMREVDYGRLGLGEDVFFLSFFFVFKWSRSTKTRREKNSL